MDLAVFAVHAGVLAVLWGFILAVLLVIRSDVFGPRPAGSSPGGGRAGRTAGGPAAAAETAAPARSRRSVRTLAVTEGPLAGTTLTLGETPVTIGRAEGCTIVLSDEYVSNRHARLVPRGRDWVLEDLESTNGTYLDGSRVTEPTVVRPGRDVRIGQTVLQLRR